MQSTIKERVTRALRGQRGQGVIEYVGILAIIALIVIAVASSPIGTTVRTAFENQVSRITNPQPGANDAQED
jgi:Flp pilus assembly pilin Flp